MLPRAHATEIVLQWPSGGNGLIDDVAHKLYSYLLYYGGGACLYKEISTHS